MDNETQGVGNSVDFGARVYDSRIGRWLSLDPLQAKYPSMSPYNGMGDNPILMVDVDGREIVPANKESDSNYKRIYSAADKETKVKLDLLQKSDIKYYIDCNNDLAHLGREGATEYNFKEKRVDIRIDKNSQNKIASLGDELEGAYQFEIGKIGYVLTDKGVNSLGYDMSDEVDSKRAAVKANESVNKKEIWEGTILIMNDGLKQFQNYDNDLNLEQGESKNERLESYFANTKGGNQYMREGVFDSRGKNLGEKHQIYGNTGYPLEQWQSAVDSGKIKNFIYRAEKMDGSHVTQTQKA